MYRFLRGLVRVLLQIVFGLRVSGLENIPEHGGAVIAANHTSFLDPFAVGVALNRPIHFMAKAELFRSFWVRQLVVVLKAFPVKRGSADRNAIRTAIGLVDSQELVGIFPEGTRGVGEETLPMQGGAALIALKGQVPVIPVVVVGVRKPRPRKPIVVLVGRPIELTSRTKVNKEVIIEATQMIAEQFTELLQKENRVG